MHLSDYYKSLTPAQRSALADKLGIARRYLYHQATGRRPVNPELWAGLVRESDGQITFDALAAVAEQRRQSRVAPALPPQDRAA